VTIYDVEARLRDGSTFVATVAANSPRGAKLRCRRLAKRRFPVLVSGRLRYPVCERLSLMAHYTRCVRVR